MKRGGLCSWCYNLDSISCALLFQQIHSEALVSMVTHEFSGALLLCLPPSALSVIAVNMPPVRHSLLAVSTVVCACACAFPSWDDMPEKLHRRLQSGNCVFPFRQASFPFDIPQSFKSPVIMCFLVICNRTEVVLQGRSNNMHHSVSSFLFKFNRFVYYVLFVWLSRLLSFPHVPHLLH